MTLYEWPRAAAFGRVIPKNKIYEHAEANTALKSIFVREVDQIVWAYKLAPETVNLEATHQVSEIQVFRIATRTAKLDREILSAIDKAIPFPLFFEVSYENRLSLMAAYKRPSEADSSRWVVSDYFHGPWIPKNGNRAVIPLALDMSKLYERLLEPLVMEEASRLVASVSEVLHTDLTPPTEENPVSIADRIAHIESIKIQAREVERIKSRLAREKQFNKRVGINAELRFAKQELHRISVRQPAQAIQN